MSENTAKTSLGFAYIARRPCGKMSAFCWDDPGYKKSTAKMVSDYIKRGESVTRVERFEGDEMPEWICKPGCNECKSAAALAGDRGEAK